jgi:hypothetical protein
MAAPLADRNFEAALKSKITIPLSAIAIAETAAAPGRSNGRLFRRRTLKVIAA